MLVLILEEPMRRVAILAAPTVKNGD